MGHPEMAGETAFAARPKVAAAEHRLEIAAPVEAVWEALFDFDGWPEWNPLYAETAGHFVEGQVVTFAVVLPGMKPSKGRSTVLAVQPGRLLEYRMVNAGGLVRALRYIELRETAPGRCMVANGEVMRGALGRFLFFLFGDRIYRGLQGMNEALKRRTEAAF